MPVDDMELDVLRRPNHIFRAGECGVIGDLPGGMAGKAVGFDYRSHKLVIGELLGRGDAAYFSSVSIVVIVLFIAVRQN